MSQKCNVIEKEMFKYADILMLGDGNLNQLYHVTVIKSRAYKTAEFILYLCTVFWCVPYSYFCNICIVLCHRTMKSISSLFIIHCNVFRKINIPETIYFIANKYLLYLFSACRLKFHNAKCILIRNRSQTCLLKLTM